ncbi:MAG: hypothetical protein ABSG76_05910 [Xanthobacteraceae bacterium]
MTISTPRRESPGRVLAARALKIGRLDRGSVRRWRAHQHLLSPLLGALEPGTAGLGAPT